MELVTPSLPPIVLLDGLLRADLVALDSALDEAVEAVKAAKLDERLAAETMREACAPLRAGMLRFNRWVRSEFDGKSWMRTLSLVPKPQASLDRFIGPIRATLCLWLMIERDAPGAVFQQQFGAPVYGREHMEAEFEAFETAWDALVDADVDLRLARAERDVIEERIVTVLTAYGHAVKARVGIDSRLARSLPPLWPGARRKRRGGS
ncbi:MAG: hypothetical protein ABMA13_23000 [Chthoniobacteraceae bacterium]